MKAALASAKDIVDGIAVFLNVVNSLVEGIVFLGCAGTPSEVTVVVGAGQETHARVFGVSVINGQPAGDSLAGRKGPVTGILMPSNTFAVTGKFAKEMGTPANDVRPQQVADTGDNARMRE